MALILTVTLTAPNSKEAVDTVVVESGLSDITVKLEDNLVVTAVGSEDAVLKGVEVNLFVPTFLNLFIQKYELLLYDNDYKYTIP
jgi:hypothetical protein